MHINHTIFREYDIRGRIDKTDELTDEAIEALGRAFATFLKRRSIGKAIVGYDARPYSEKVKDITVKALLRSGIDVIEIGEVLVPIFYFSQYFLKQKGGVMITASHNPWGWSGFKHAYDYSTTFMPQDVAELRDIVERDDAGNYHREFTAPNGVRGEHKRTDDRALAREDYFSGGEGSREIYPGIIEAYTKDVLDRVKIARPLRVLVDAGNGTAGPIAPDILRRAGCTVIEQYTDVQETRHHEANPSTLGMLKAMAEGVEKNAVDLGIGIDDDGDRLGAVDETGAIIWPDSILLLLARPILARHPGAKIVFDVKCTEALVEDVRARGGAPVMWKTGHSYIKAKAKEIGALLAGERSGHIYFPGEHYEFDDAVFAALKLIEYVSGQSRPLSEIMAALPRYATSPVWHAPCADEKKYAVAEELTKQLKSEYGPDKVIDINGARAYLEDGWGLVRASSNVPALVLVFEAKTPEGLKRIEEVFRAKLARFSEVGKEWVSG
jgi:phosphomannomutase/phosphoglucomutase